MDDRPITQEHRDRYQDILNRYFPFVTINSDADDDSSVESAPPIRNVRQRTVNSTTAETGIIPDAANRGGRTGGNRTMNNGRVRFGGFVANNTIRSGAHATALIGLLQLASGHEGGLFGSLGHNNRARWVQENSEILFSSDGPLGNFLPVSSAVLQRHVGTAQAVARSIWERIHSNDDTGTMHEDVPEWAGMFF
jgi:hypothetical protein